MPEFPVESMNVRAFAQAIGDHDPVHVDPTCADAVQLGGLAAPLTFVLAAAQVDPDYPLRPRDDRPRHGAGATGGHTDPLGVGLLHAERTFDCHRPVLVGDVLPPMTDRCAAGRRWAPGEGCCTSRSGSPSTAIPTVIPSSRRRPAP
ncbi:MAG: MaoC family dehydratase N-terminal domain-containing protein [Marmoricola sp.]